MLRLAYGVGGGYLVLCGVVLLRAAASGTPPPAAVEGPLPAPHGQPARSVAAGAPAWFAGIRARCNAAEADVALRGSPPPPGSDGAAYKAACYALAGKMDSAKQAIDGVAPGARASAAGIVFDIIHPVADAGDDKSAGPMMRLVLDYVPDNFMALYHAGMSEYAVGDRVRARVHLRRFLDLYTVDDGWVRNAREILGRPDMVAAP